MAKIEYYRQIFPALKELCTTGQQFCSSREYCQKHGVSYNKMYQIAKDELNS